LGGLALTPFIIHPSSFIVPYANQSRFDYKSQQIAVGFSFEEYSTMSAWHPSLLAPIFVLAATAPGLADSWTDLSSGEKALEAWASPTGDWFCAASTESDSKNPKTLRAEPGQGILVNGKKGRTVDLVTKQKFKDVEVHVEFMIPKGSNSGVKFEGLYEIQILDSFGVKKPKGSDCGGIYPRAEEEPQYHHIDDGVPPRTNAARPAGEWQTLDVIFQAPRFDAQNKKVANARFVKVVLNGQVIHENVEVRTPTGSAWRLKKEMAQGPLLLQGTHGPVAFRNVRIRPYTEEKPAKP
jgi:Domain of Unknown Function (DUF1080)